MFVLLPQAALTLFGLFCEARLGELFVNSPLVLTFVRQGGRGFRLVTGGG